MMRKLLVLFAALTLTGCGLVDVIEENESSARLVTTYATLKVIDGDNEKADRVVEIAQEVSRLAGDDPEVTVDLLVARIRSLIRWDRLDEADTLLVDALLLELSARLKDKLGDELIPKDARVTVQTVAEWVISAAALARDDES